MKRRTLILAFIVWDFLALSDPAAAAKLQKALEIADKYRAVYEDYAHKMHEARFRGPARADVQRQMRDDESCTPCHERGA